ncbi:MAG: murein L,D-transpeptidase catalytic domain family protein [bacterium]
MYSKPFLFPALFLAGFTLTILTPNHLTAARAKTAPAAVSGPSVTYPAVGSAAPDSPLLRALLREAPGIDREALQTALAAAERAWRTGAAKRSDVLAVIDFSLPSTEQRLWVFDLKQRRLIFNELVAHGAGSGSVYATEFSNRSGSRMSSLGTFVTAETYQGKHGYSIRLKGLDEGLNDNSYRRAVVLHPAAYVSNEYVARNGRLGRSWGCPAVRPEISRQLIDTIRGGAVLFAYYPGRTGTDSTSLLAGASDPAAQETAAK